jgi:hypothetical protein
VAFDLRKLIKEKIMIGNLLTNVLTNAPWIAVGAVIIMLLPPKYEDWLRQGIVTLWNKVFKRG